MLNDSSARLHAAADELSRSFNEFAKELRLANARTHAAVPLSHGFMKWWKSENEGWQLVWETERAADVMRTPIERAPIWLRVEASARLDDLMLAVSDAIEEMVADVTLAALAVRAATERLKNR